MNGRASIKQVAAESGFSLFTVSKVLNGHAEEARISVATRDTVIETARRMNYQPSAAARAVRNQRSNWVGILIRNAPDAPLQYPMAYEIILGIDDALCAAGYATTIVRISDVKSMRTESRAFREHMLDAMIVMDQLPDEVHRHVRASMPICLWVESDMWRPNDCLRRDDKDVGRGVVRHAAAQGYSRLLIPSAPGSRAHYAMHERHASMVSEADRLGLQVTMRPPLEQVAAVKAVLGDLRTDTAVVTSGTWDADSLYRWAAEAGKLAGRDYGLIATDEDEQIRRCWPDLSRYAFDRFGLGQTAGAMLLERLKDGTSVPSRRVASAWIPGETFGKRRE